jgi:hypothetical protein
MKPRITFDSANAYNKTVDFDIEVADDDEVEFSGIGRDAVGGDGVKSNFTLQYIQEVIDLSFNWMSQDIYDQLRFAMLNYILGGDTFRYYPDQTDTTRYYECVFLGNNHRFNPGRAHPSIVEFRVKFRARVKAVSAQITTDRAAWYP